MDGAGAAFGCWVRFGAGAGLPLQELFEGIAVGTKAFGVGGNAELGGGGFEVFVAGAVTKGLPKGFEIFEEFVFVEGAADDGGEAGGFGGGLPATEVAVDDLAGVFAAGGVLVGAEGMGFEEVGDAADVGEELVGSDVHLAGGLEADGLEGGFPAVEAAADGDEGVVAVEAVVGLGEVVLIEEAGDALEIGEEEGVWDLFAAGARGGWDGWRGRE